MWSDLSQAIRDRLYFCLPYYKRAHALVYDPAVSFLAICPDVDTLIVKHAAELQPESKKALEAFSKVRDSLTLDDTILIKQAITLDRILHPVSAATQAAQRLIGGPNALTNTLVGGALGGLGGYALGKAYDNLVPRALKRILPDGDETIGETNMASGLGMLGAGLGGSFGAFRGATNMLNGYSVKDSWLGSQPWGLDTGELSMNSINPEFTKNAEAAGAVFIPSIPVDAFNQAIWSNVAPANPFGTRSAWGDNDQSLYTPPAVAAAMGGLVSAAGAAKGSDWVSPWDVASVAANAGINAGLGGLSGAAAGLVAGKMLGALAGLAPEAQKYLQRTGLWSGVLTGLARSLF